MLYVVILAVQAKLTGSGYRMLDLQLPSISESKVTRCCWLRWKAFTPCRTLTVLLTFIWGSPTLFWSQLINRHKITTLLSLRVLLRKCSLQRPFFTTVTRQEAFLLLPLVAQLLRLTGLLNKLGLSGTYFHPYVVGSIYKPYIWLFCNRFCLIHTFWWVLIAIQKHHVTFRTIIFQLYYQTYIKFQPSFKNSNLLSSIEHYMHKKWTSLKSCQLCIKPGGIWQQADQGLTLKGHIIMDWSTLPGQSGLQILLRWSMASKDML